jgi:hypothetical protein
MATPSGRRNSDPVPWPRASGNAPKSADALAVHSPSLGEVLAKIRASDHAIVETLGWTASQLATSLTLRRDKSFG